MVPLCCLQSIHPSIPSLALAPMHLSTPPEEAGEDKQGTLLCWRVISFPALMIIIIINKKRLFGPREYFVQPESAILGVKGVEVEGDSGSTSELAALAVQGLNPAQGDSGFWGAL